MGSRYAYYLYLLFPVAALGAWKVSSGRRAVGMVEGSTIDVGVIRAERFHRERFIDTHTPPRITSPEREKILKLLMWA